MYDVGLTVGLNNEADIQRRIHRLFSSVNVRMDAPNEKLFKQPLGRIRGELGEFQKSLDASNARVIAFGLSAGAIYSITTALKATVSAAIEVEKTLNEIGVIMGRSTSSMAKFGSQLFQTANQMGASFSDAAKAALEFSRQGLSMQETLKRTSDALLLTRISGISAQDAVSTLTASLNSFRDIALDSFRVVNQLAAVDMRFAVSANDLSEALRRVGSTASDAGVSFEQLIALITSAQQTTQRGGSVIGNALKSIFTRLGRPKVLEQLEAVGIGLKNANGSARPLLGVLSDLAKNYDNLTNAQQSHIAELVGGVYQMNILKAILKDTGREFSTYEIALRTATEATDEAKQRSEELNTTLSAKLLRTGNKLKEFGSNFGSLIFGPTIDKTLNTLNKGLDFNLGGKVGSAILAGIGKALSGPGITFMTLIFAQLGKRMVAFLEDATKQMSGLDRVRKNSLEIEKGAYAWLSKQEQKMKDLASNATTLKNIERDYIQYLHEEYAIMESITLASKYIARNLTARGYTGGVEGAIAGTLRAGEIKPPKAVASGYIPALAAEPATPTVAGAAIAERAGAIAGGYQAGNIKQMTLEGQRIVYNDKERVVPVQRVMPWVQSNSSFILPPEGSLARQKYDKQLVERNISPDIFRSSGFVPNLAKQGTFLYEEKAPKKQIRLESGTPEEYAKDYDLRGFMVESEAGIAQFRGKKAVIHGLRPEKAALFNSLIQTTYPPFVTNIAKSVFGVQALPAPYSIKQNSVTFGPVRGAVFEDMIHAVLGSSPRPGTMDIAKGTVTQNEKAVLAAFMGTEALEPGVIGRMGAEIKTSLKAMRQGIRGGKIERGGLEAKLQSKGVLYTGEGGLSNSQRILINMIDEENPEAIELAKGERGVRELLGAKRRELQSRGIITYAEQKLELERQRSIRRAAELAAQKLGPPTFAKGYIPNLSVLGGISSLGRNLGLGLRIASKLGPAVNLKNVANFARGKGDANKFMSELQTFLASPSSFIKTREDLQGVSSLLNFVTSNKLVREKLANTFSTRIGTGSFSSARVAKRMREGGRQNYDPLENYAIYRLLGGVKEPDDYFERNAPSAMMSLLRNRKGSYSISPIGRNSPKFLEDIASGIRVAMGGQYRPYIGRGMVGGNRLVAHNFTFGRFLAKFNKAKTKAVYQDRWDVGLHRTERQFLDKYLNGGNIEEVNTEWKNNLQSKHSHESNIDDLLVRELVSKMKGSNPITFEGVVRLSSGYIPNLARTFLGKGSYGSFELLSRGFKGIPVGVKSFSGLFGKQNVTKEYLMAKAMESIAMSPLYGVPKTIGSLERSVVRMAMGKEAILGSKTYKDFERLNKAQRDEIWPLFTHFQRNVANEITQQNIYPSDFFGHTENTLINPKAQELFKKVARNPRTAETLLDRLRNNPTLTRQVMSAWARQGAKMHIIDPGMFHFVNQDEPYSHFVDVPPHMSFAGGRIPNLANPALLRNVFNAAHRLPNSSAVISKLREGIGLKDEAFLRVADKFQVPYGSHTSQGTADMNFLGSKLSEAFSGLGNLKGDERWKKITETFANINAAFARTEKIKGIPMTQNEKTNVAFVQGLFKRQFANLGDFKAGKAGDILTEFREEAFGGRRTNIYDLPHKDFVQQLNQYVETQKFGVHRGRKTFRTSSAAIDLGVDDFLYAKETSDRREGSVDRYVQKRLTRYQQRGRFAEGYMPNLAMPLYAMKRLIREAKERGVFIRKVPRSQGPAYSPGTGVVIAPKGEASEGVAHELGHALSGLSYKEGNLNRTVLQRERAANIEVLKRLKPEHRKAYRESSLPPYKTYQASVWMNALMAPMRDNQLMVGLLTNTVAESLGIDISQNMSVETMRKFQSGMLARLTRMWKPSRLTNIVKTSKQSDFMKDLRATFSQGRIPNLGLTVNQFARMPIRNEGEIPNLAYVPFVTPLAGRFASNLIIPYGYNIRASLMLMKEKGLGNVIKSVLKNKPLIQDNMSEEEFTPESILAYPIRKWAFQQMFKKKSSLADNPFLAEHLQQTGPKTFAFKEDSAFTTDILKNIAGLGGSPWKPRENSGGFERVASWHPIMGGFDAAVNKSGSISYKDIWDVNLGRHEKPTLLKDVSNVSSAFLRELVRYPIAQGGRLLRALSKRTKDIKPAAKDFLRAFSPLTLKQSVKHATGVARGTYGLSASTFYGGGSVASLLRAGISKVASPVTFEGSITRTEKNARLFDDIINSVPQLDDVPMASGYIPNLTTFTDFLAGKTTGKLQFIKDAPSTGEKELRRFLFLNDTNSSVSYHVTPKKIDLTYLHSRHKGDAFKMFKTLAKMSRRLKRPLVSGAISPQSDRLPLIDSNKTNWDNLLTIYPMLRYRQIPKLNTSGRLSMSTPGGPENIKFQNLGQLQKYVNYFHPEEFQSSLREDNLSFSNLVSEYLSGGFIPNLAVKFWPLRGSEYTKKLYEKYPPDNPNMVLEPPFSNEEKLLLALTRGHPSVKALDEITSVFSRRNNLFNVFRTEGSKYLSGAKGAYSQEGDVMHIDRSGLSRGNLLNFMETVRHEMGHRIDRFGGFSQDRKFRALTLRAFRDYKRSFPKREVQIPNKYVYKQNPDAPWGWDSIETGGVKYETYNETRPKNPVDTYVERILAGGYAKENYASELFADTMSGLVAPNIGATRDLVINHPVGDWIRTQLGLSSSNLLGIRNYAEGFIPNLARLYPIHSTSRSNVSSILKLGLEPRLKQTIETLKNKPQFMLNPEALEDLQKEFEAIRIKEFPTHPSRLSSVFLGPSTSPFRQGGDVASLKAVPNRGSRIFDVNVYSQAFMELLKSNPNRDLLSQLIRRYHQTSLPYSRGNLSRLLQEQGGAFRPEILSPGSISPNRLRLQGFAGFMPNLAVSLNENRPGLESSFSTDQGGLLRFILEGKKIDFLHIKAGQKGDGTRLFKALAKYAKKHNSVIHSGGGGLTRQFQNVSKPETFGDNWTMFKALYPQIGYREKVTGLKTWGTMRLQQQYEKFNSLSDLRRMVESVPAGRRDVIIPKIGLQGVKSAFVAQGHVPNLTLDTPAVVDALQREIGAGYSPSQVKVGFDARIGPLVYNTTEGSAGQAVDMHIKQGRSVGDIKHLGQNKFGGHVPNLAEEGGMFPSMLMGVVAQAAMFRQGGGYLAKEIEERGKILDRVKKQLAVDTMTLSSKKRLERIQDKLEESQNRAQSTQGRYQRLQSKALTTSFILPIAGGAIEAGLQDMGPRLAKTGKVFGVLSEAASMAATAIFALPGPLGIATGIAVGGLMAISKGYHAIADKAPAMERSLAKAREHFEEASGAINNFVQIFDKLSEAYKGTRASEETINKLHQEYIAALAEVPKEYRAQIAGAASAADAQNVFNEVLGKEAKKIQEFGVATKLTDIIDKSKGALFDTSVFDTSTERGRKDMVTLVNRMLSSSSKPQELAKRIATTDITSRTDFSNLIASARAAGEVGDDLAASLDRLVKRSASLPGWWDKGAEGLQAFGKALQENAKDLYNASRSLPLIQKLREDQGRITARLQKQSEEANQSIVALTDSIFNLAASGLAFANTRATLRTEERTNTAINQIGLAQNALSQLGGGIGNRTRGRLEDALNLGKTQVEGAGKFAQLSSDAVNALFDNIKGALMETRRTAAAIQNKTPKNPAEEQKAINALISLEQLRGKLEGGTPEQAFQAVMGFTRQNEEILGTRRGDVLNKSQQIITELITTRAKLDQDFREQLRLMVENNRINEASRRIAEAQRTLGGAQGFLNPEVYKEGTMQMIRGLSGLITRGPEAVKGGSAFDLLKGAQSALGLEFQGSGANSLRELAIQARAQELHTIGQSWANRFAGAGMSAPRGTIERYGLLGASAEIRQKFSLQNAMQIARDQITTEIPISQMPKDMSRLVKIATDILAQMKTDTTQALTEGARATDAINKWDSNAVRRTIAGRQQMITGYENQQKDIRVATELNAKVAELIGSETTRTVNADLFNQLRTRYSQGDIVGTLKTLAASTEDKETKTRANDLIKRVGKFGEEKLANYMMDSARSNSSSATSLDVLVRTFTTGNSGRVHDKHTEDAVNNLTKAITAGAGLEGVGFDIKGSAGREVTGKVAHTAGLGLLGAVVGGLVGTKTGRAFSATAFNYATQGAKALYGRGPKPVWGDIWQEERRNLKLVGPEAERATKPFAETMGGLGRRAGTAYGRLTRRASQGLLGYLGIEGTGVLRNPMAGTMTKTLENLGNKLVKDETIKYRTSVFKDAPAWRQGIRFSRWENMVSPITGIQGLYPGTAALRTRSVTVPEGGISDRIGRFLLRSVAPRAVTAASGGITKLLNTSIPGLGTIFDKTISKNLLSLGSKLTGGKAVAAAAIPNAPWKGLDIITPTRGGILGRTGGFLSRNAARLPRLARGVGGIASILALDPLVNRIYRNRPDVEQEGSVNWVSRERAKTVGELGISAAFGPLALLLTAPFLVKRVKEISRAVDIRGRQEPQAVIEKSTGLAEARNKRYQNIAASLTNPKLQQAFQQRKAALEIQGLIGQFESLLNEDEINKSKGLDILNLAGEGKDIIESRAQEREQIKEQIRQTSAAAGFNIGKQVDVLENKTGRARLRKGLTRYTKPITETQRLLGVQARQNFGENLQTVQTQNLEGIMEMYGIGTNDALERQRRYGSRTSTRQEREAFNAYEVKRMGVLRALQMKGRQEGLQGQELELYQALGKQYVSPDFARQQPNPQQWQAFEQSYANRYRRMQAAGLGPPLQNAPALQNLIQNVNGYSQYQRGQLPSKDALVEKAFLRDTFMGRMVFQNDDPMSRRIRNMNQQQLDVFLGRNKIAQEDIQRRMLSNAPQMMVQQAYNKAMQQERDLNRFMLNPAARPLPPGAQEATGQAGEELTQTLEENVNRVLPQAATKFGTLAAESFKQAWAGNQGAGTNGKMDMNGQVNVNFGGQIKVNGQDIQISPEVVAWIQNEIIRTLGRVDPRFRNLRQPQQQQAGQQQPRKQ